MNAILMTAMLSMGATIYDQGSLYPAPDNAFATQKSTLVLELLALPDTEGHGLVLNLTPGSQSPFATEARGQLIKHEEFDFEYRDIAFRRPVTGEYHSRASRIWCPETRDFEEFYFTAEAEGFLEARISNGRKTFHRKGFLSTYLTQDTGPYPEITTANTVTVNWTLHGPLSSVSGSFETIPFDGPATSFYPQDRIVESDPDHQGHWMEHASVYFSPDQLLMETVEVDGVEFDVKQHLGGRLVIIPEPSAMALALLGFGLILGRRRTR